MKKILFIGAFLASICLVVTSCITGKPTAQASTPFRCYVESGTEMAFEVHLDGKFVSSSKTMPPAKGTMEVDLVTTPGDHVLAVTAQGYETWRKNITVLDGLKYGPVFLIDLKKAEK